MGEHNHPEVSMHTHPLSEYMEFIYKGNWQAVADLMLSSAQKLAKIGADFLICPDNTIHQSFGLVVKQSPLPWLHIAEQIALLAHQKGYKKLGITGTRYLMEGPVYKDILAKNGLGHVIPDKDQREEINRIIFEELVSGEFKDQARNYFTEVITSFKAQGCDAVVLGCTEIPLLVTPASSPLPILDSTRTLARAALKKAVST
jgi:aspartate racemase